MRLAIVISRHGTGVLGGAERHGAELGLALAGAGHEVDLLAGHANPLDPITDASGDVRIRRVPIETSPEDVAARRRLDPLVRAGVRLGADEEAAWLRGGGDLPGLAGLIEDAAYDAVIALPYLAASTWRAAQAAAACGTAFILIPCLHDEPTARLAVFAELYAGATGVLFNVAPEAALAARLYPPRPRCALGGLGFPSLLDAAGRPVPQPRAAARRRPGDPVELVYIGRWEVGKGVPELVAQVRRLRRAGTDVRLRLVGGGPEIPREGDGIDVLGHVDEAAKAEVLDASTALVLPSRLESLSIVVMEAWLRERPVLVSSFCDVTRAHVVRSGGGLHYASTTGLGAGVDALAADPELVAAMGAAGRRYVSAEFAWPDIIARITARLTEWVA